MGAQAEAADVTVGGGTEPVPQIAVVAGADQRVGPGGAVRDGEAGQQPMVQRNSPVDALDHVCSSLHPSTSSANSVACPPSSVGMVRSAASRRNARGRRLP